MKKLCLFSLATLLACSTPLSNGCSFSAKSGDLVHANEEGLNSSGKDDIVLSPSNQSGFFNSSTFSFIFLIKYGVDISFEENGCSVLDFSLSQEKLVVKIHILENDSYLITRARRGEVLVEKKVYFYRNTKGEVYYSLLSFDSAKKLSGIDSSSLYSGIGGIPIGPIQRAKTFGCSFFWKDSHKTEFPLVGAKVYIKTHSGKSIYKFTDSSGLAYFNFNRDESFVGGGTEYLSSMWSEISNNQYTLSLSLSNSLIHRTDSENKDYSIDFSNQLVTGTNAKNISYCFEPANGNQGSDFGQAAQIFQALYYYSQHAYALDNKKGSIKLCNVEYPAATKGDSYNNQTIYIGNGSDNNKSGFSYESWDAIGHEYGHHLEHLFNISNSKGGAHYIDCDNSTRIKCNPSSYATKRDYNLRLAWAEAWATIWAAVAQKSFPEIIKNEAYFGVGDDQYTASNLGYDSDGKPVHFSYNPSMKDTGEIDYNHQIAENNAGDGCELSIERFLYQLFDNDNDETDKYVIPESELWNYTLDVAKEYKLDAEDKAKYEGKQEDRYKLNYFYQYLSALESKYGFDGIAELAECYNLCPSYPFLKCENGTYKVLWKRNLSNTKFACYRYNNFRIKLYKSKEDLYPILLSGDNPFSEKTINISDIYYDYYILDNNLISKIKSAGSQACLSIESYYFPIGQSNYDYLGPVEGPKAMVDF